MEVARRNKKDQMNGLPKPSFVSNMPNMHISPLDVKKKEGFEDDPFAVSCDDTLDEAPSRPIVNILKALSVFILMYFFICSLDFMATAFRLISGKTTGYVLQNEYIKNPIVGLMIGILVTVLVQSSSTSTSIIVSMVNSKILQVRTAIPMIMGSNIGTSVTNTIVSFTQIGDRSQFRRAFAGATVHDMFNWLTVITLLSVEVPFHILESLTDVIVDKAFHFEEEQQGTNIKILKHITEPFTKLVIKIDKKVITGWSHNDSSYAHKTLNPCYNAHMDHPNDTEYLEKKCDYAFALIPLDDTKTGIILLILSLFMLCTALIVIVKLLNSMLKGAIANMVRNVINADIPYVPWLTGYVAIIIGAVLTFIVQSSSIFTSTLTPLIGLGLITVERSYPLTLGSNIGTTTTSLLASIAGEGDGLKRSVQIALVHLFFNIFGILLFYPVPFMRWPIRMAKCLGNVTADYRWFSIMYLILMFFLFPAFVFGLSLGGSIYLQCIGLPVLIIAILVVIINILQNKCACILPGFLKTWTFLPLFLRSLQPYDKMLTSLPCCKSCRTPYASEIAVPDTVLVIRKESVSNNVGVDNPVFDEPPTRL